MTDHEWQQAYNAGRREAEGLVEALERCIAVLDSLGGGPVWRDAKAALEKYQTPHNLR